MRLSTEEVISFLDMNFDLNLNETFDDTYFNLWGFLVKVETSSIQSKNTLEAQFVNFIESQPDSEPDIVIRVIRVHSFLTFPGITDYSEYSRENKQLVVGPFYICKFNEALDYVEVIVKSDEDSFMLSVMRVIAPHLASKLNGSLLHASAVSYHNQLYTFIGESGVGKSTIIKMIPDYPILSDEAIMIVKDQACPTGFLGLGTPYGREHGGANISVPLGYCFFLVQDTTTYLKKVKPGEALPILLANLWCTSTMNDLALKAFELLMQISQQVPCYELHFELNNKFWEEIDRVVLDTTV